MKKIPTFKVQSTFDPKGRSKNSNFPSNSLHGSMLKQKTAFNVSAWKPSKKNSIFFYS